MNKKIRDTFIVISTILLFLMCFVMHVNAKENIKIEEVENSYKGTVVKVSAAQNMSKLRIYQQLSDGSWIKFYEDYDVNASSKNYFISKYRLSDTSKTKLKVIAICDDGTEISSELEVKEIPSEPTPTQNPSTSPSAAPTSTTTPTPSTTPTVKPSTTPTPTPTQQPTTVSLNKTSIKLYSNGKNSETLKVTVSPSGSATSIKWSTTNKKVAKVDSKGKVTAVGEGTATIKATINSKTVSCKVNVDKLSLIDSTLNTKNCKREFYVTPKLSDCPVAQSFCVTDKYYVCALKNSGDSKQVLQVYDKKGKYVKKFVYTNLNHANGMTYNPNTGLIYLAPLKGSKYFTFKASTISKSKLTTGSSSFKYPISGLAYDAFKNEYYTTSGATLRRYDSNMKYLNTFKKHKYTIGQDIGCYNGLILAIDYVKKGDAYLYIHRASNGQYLGKYHVTLPGELESVTYDQYTGKFALFFNNGKNNAVYTTTAIKLDKYCR